jgi:hypothetical protein
MREVRVIPERDGGLVIGSSRTSAYGERVRVARPRALFGVAWPSQADSSGREWRVRLKATTAGRPARFGSSLLSPRAISPRLLPLACSP